MREIKFIQNKMFYGVNFDGEWWCYNKNNMHVMKPILDKCMTELTNELKKSATYSKTLN